MNERHKYLTAEVPKLLKELKPDHKRSFGLMSPQHMVEHLIWVTKSSVKDYGPAPEELSEGQKKFMMFVKKGARLYHRPSDKTKDDLKPVRLPDLDTAKGVIPDAISRLYDYDRSHTFYNPMMGVLSFDEMELFHYMHFKYHLQHQYGLGIY